MALTPADFAAYSRATGTSYPESPEERAQMAPEVRAFRQNQLQAPQQQESNSLALGLGIGLGLAGVGGGLMALRGRAKKGGKKDVAGKSSVKMADLSDLEAPAGSYGPSVELKDYPGQPLALRTQPAQESTSQIDSRKLAQDQFAPYQFAPSLEAPIQNYGPNVEFKDYPGGSLALRAQPTQEVASDFDSRKVAQNQLASFLEAPAGSYGPNVDLKDYPLTRKQEVYQAVAAKPVSELPQVSRPQGTVEESMLITDPNTGEVYRRGGDASIRTQLAEGMPTLTETYEAFGEPATLVNSQENRLPIVQEQATDALASTDDNVINRVRLDAQRNEDLDLATGVETPAAGDPFGKSVETAQDVDLIQESRQVSAKAFLENERDNIASELAEQGLPIRPSAVERELSNRLGKEAYKYGPEYTQMKHSIELGATYDPNLLENPGAQTVRVQDQELPLSFFKEETRMPETVARQQERIQKQKDWSESIREAEAFKANKILPELLSIAQQRSNYQELDQAVSDLPKSFKTRSEQQAAQRLKGDLEAAAVAQDQLQNRLEDIQYELYKGEKRVAGAERATQENIQKIKDQGLPLKLKDPTGAGLQIRPKDSKLITDLEYEGGGAKAGVPVGPDSEIEYEMSFMRPPRTEESTKTRGSSMQYDQGDKGVVGVYGEEFGGFGQGTETQQAAAKPSLVDPEPQKYRGGYLTNPLQFESPDAQLQAKRGPSSPKAFYISSRKPVTSTALEDSEIIRRKAIEGRNPQSSLAGRAQQQSRPRIAALRQEAARRKATGDRLMTKTEAFNFLRNYPQ